MTEFIQILLNGIAIGGVYSLVALGFVVIYKASKVFNLAQGELLLCGAYILWACMAQLQLPIPLAFLVAFLVAGVLGLLIERGALRPLLGQPIETMVMMTIALSALLRGTVMLIWGGVPHYFPHLIPSESFRLGNIPISQQNIWGFFLAIAMMMVFSTFFRYTRIGLAMRATAEDHQVAQAMGISVKQVFAVTWVIAALLSVVGGFLLGSVSSVRPTLSDVGLSVVGVALLGGLDSILGCIIAGPIVGVLQNLSGFYIDPLVGGGVKDVAPFVVMVIIVLFRPEGIFGQKRIERI